MRGLLAPWKERLLRVLRGSVISGTVTLSGSLKNAMMAAEVKSAWINSVKINYCRYNEQILKLNYQYQPHGRYNVVNYW